MVQLVGIARPEDMPGFLERVKSFVPDDARAAMIGAMFFELQPRAGVLWITNLRIGRCATVHIVVWDASWRKKDTALRALIQEGFQMFQLRRMDANIPITNIPACRLAERLGFRLDGILRLAGSVNGELVDVMAYSILKEDL